MPDIENISPFADLSQTALAEAKKKLEGEGINPANIGILGHNLSAALAEKLVAAEELHNLDFSKELARYMRDDLSHGFRDEFPEEVAKVALDYLEEYGK